MNTQTYEDPTVFMGLSKIYGPTGREHKRELSTRELEVFLLLGKGFGTSDISRILGNGSEDLSDKTVETHYRNISVKLDINNEIHQIRKSAIIYNYSHNFQSEDDKIYFKSLPADELIDELSDREKEVYRLVGKGLSTKEIVEQLIISPKTVERHYDNIKNKLHLKSRIEILFHAVLFYNKKDIIKNRLKNK